jgi:outer membrane lipopolysaccharide assembly protein LptE/RlpB
MRTARHILLSVLALTTLCGCGYSLASRNTLLPSGQSVAVRQFANRTYQPNIEAEFRRALVSELVARGSNVTDDVTEFVVSGEIVSLATDMSAFSAADKVAYYRVSMEVRLQLVDRRSDTVAWKGSETVVQEYPANTDLALQRNAREAAVTAACARAAQRLVARMNQSF